MKITASELGSNPDYLLYSVNQRKTMEEKKKILIVEDEQDFAKIVRMRLESEGYEVYVAEDAYQGTHEAVQGEYDLIILDLKMPAGGGFALLRRIRNLPAKSQLPVMIFTSSDLDEDEEEAKTLGADAFMLKTTKTTIMLDVIQKLLGRDLTPEPSVPN